VQFLIIMVLMLGVMYVLMIRPQRQRQAQQQSTIDRAGVGDDVLTTGGIYGTITEADSEDVLVEIAPGVEVHLTRRAIAAVLPPEADEEEGDAELEPADDVGDSDEGVVTDGEEAVRSAVGDAPSGDDRR
jgi:preprotein translocase subunit YajC